MKNRLRMLSRYLILGVVVWLIASVAINNIMVGLLEYFKHIKIVQDFINPQQKYLIFIIKYVETPCILSSFMVYLLYEIYLALRKRFHKSKTPVNESSNIIPTNKE